MPEQETVYEIHIAGHLSPRRAAHFSGLAVTPLADGSTLLSGPLPDQAALHGLLAQLRDLGLPLLALRRRDPGGQQEERGDNS